MVRRRWSQLNPRTKQVLVAAGAFEAALKVGALVDLTRRPATDVRGSKLGWALAIVVVNSAGAVPIAYFTRGAR